MITAQKTKELLEPHGEVRSQPPGDWAGKIPLPLAIEQYYREVGPANITIDAHGNPYFLPSLADLWQFQAGYRWNGRNGEAIEDWNNDWIVVADEGGDPFIFDQSSGTVLRANHGEGSWDAAEMFPNLPTMAASLAILGSMISEAGDSYMDEECEILPEFRDLASSRLLETVSPEVDAERVLGMLGFG